MCWIQIFTDIPLINQTLCDCHVLSLWLTILVVTRQCQAEALDSNLTPSFPLPGAPGLTSSLQICNGLSCGGMSHCC